MTEFIELIGALLVLVGGACAIAGVYILARYPPR